MRAKPLQTPGVSNGQLGQRNSSSRFSSATLQHRGGASSLGSGSLGSSSASSSSALPPPSPGPMSSGTNSGDSSLEKTFVRGTSANMLRVPAVLWNPSPPSHAITAMLLLDKGLFTGSASGQCVLWNLHSDSAVPTPSGTSRKSPRAQDGSSTTPLSSSRNSTSSSSSNSQLPPSLRRHPSNVELEAQTNPSVVAAVGLRRDSTGLTGVALTANIPSNNTSGSSESASVGERTTGLHNPPVGSPPSLPIGAVSSPKPMTRAPQSHSGGFVSSSLGSSGMSTTPGSTTLVLSGSTTTVVSGTGVGGGQSSSSSSSHPHMGRVPPRGGPGSGSSSPPLPVAGQVSTVTNADPVAVLYGHRAAVTALAPCVYEWTSAVVSAACDLSLAVWHAVDGRCLASSERGLLSGKPTTLEAHPNRRSVLVGSDTGLIELVDLRTLTVVAVLGGPTDSITSLVTMEAGTAVAPVPLSAATSADGTLHFWDLSSSSSSTTTPAFSARLPASAGPAITVAPSPSLSLLLLVTPSHALVFAADSLKLLAHLEVPSGAVWAGGSWMGPRLVVLWNSRGSSAVFPIPAHLDSSVSRLRAAPVSANNACVRLSLPQDAKDVVTVFPAAIGRMASTGTPGNPSSSSSSRNGGGSAVRPVVVAARSPLIVAGDHSGALTVWRIDDDSFMGSSRALPFGAFSDPTTSEANHGGSGDQGKSHSYIEIAVSGHGSLSDGWEELDAGAPRTTATVVAQADARSAYLARGSSDGMIELFRVPLSAPPWPLRIASAHAGAVTALASISSPPFLLSGGADGSVSVWDWKTGTRLSSHPVHSRPVRALAAAPRGVLSDGTPAYYSVGADAAVALFGIGKAAPVALFGGHGSAVAAVAWRPAADYVLIEGEDGSVAVWALSTATLESLLIGSEAAEAMNGGVSATGGDRLDELGDGPPRFVVSPHNACIEHLPLMSDSRDACAQMLVLNVERMADLFASTKAYASSIRAAAREAAGGSETTKPKTPTVGLGGTVRFPLALTAFASLTYLLPWGLSSSLDNLIGENLGLEAPNPRPSPAALGSGGAVSVLVPRRGNRPGSAWSTSRYMSAVASVGVVAAAQALCSVAPHAATALMTLVSTGMGDVLPNYATPSFTKLARFWPVPQSDVQQAARSLFGAQLDAMTSSERRALAAVWIPRLPRSDIPTSDEQSLAVLVLGILGAERPEAMSNAVLEQVTGLLVNLVAQRAVLGPLAAELLGAGFKVFRKHLASGVEHLMSVIFGLILSSGVSPSGKAAATRALAAIGRVDPSLFVSSLGGEVMAVSKSPLPRSAALSVFQVLIGKAPAALLPELPRTVEAIVRALDPEEPGMRDGSLAAATSTLHELVRRYPMVSFHQDLQKLAMGTDRGVVILYDLRTASKWLVLEGHSKSVSAVRFARNGRQLATYSALDCTLRIWNTGTSLMAVLGGSRCQHTFTVPGMEKVLAPSLLLESVKIKWETDRSLWLLRGTADHSTTFKIKF